MDDAERATALEEMAVARKAWDDASKVARERAKEWWRLWHILYGTPEPCINSEPW